MCIFIMAQVYEDYLPPQSRMPPNKIFEILDQSGYQRGDHIDIFNLEPLKMYESTDRTLYIQVPLDNIYNLLTLGCIQSYLHRTQ